ncbi:MAG: riboflavin kinase [Alectoria fallacina]|uniref:Riboflavin kinase n=1 Tax=Alectoria fallacina TaxID=1903189 RepID=A0A8H3EFG0_9LECA|nr:MAG: riboflavin kinase [Alectoria fallacina]
MRPSSPRPLVAGPSTGPEPPFPIRLSGPIVKGFGRGSAELGIPTANIPLAGLSVGGNEDVESGVYYGWAGVDVDDTGLRKEKGGTGEGERREGVWGMVMSIGWNPYYKNKVRSVGTVEADGGHDADLLWSYKEVHIMHAFHHDFYGARMNLLICGFIRPELDYVSKESLIEDINVDIEVAKKSLEREAYLKLNEEMFLLEFGSEGHENEVAS